MRLKNLNLNKLVPNFMENDACVKAMNATLEPLVKELASKANRMSLWGNLYALTEEELDNIAYEFDIPWYNNTYDKEKKINIIKNNEKLMRKLGTPYTLKQVLVDIFGGCELKESVIDYEGEPYHFIVMVANGENLDEVSYARLNFLLKKVKRSSSKLDTVASIYNAILTEQHAMRMQDIAIDSVKMDINNKITF